jgi:alkylation response protein AidB-like acyl-CoA dehydrogenase
MLMSDDAILAVLVAMVSILLVCAAVVVAAGAYLAVRYRSRLVNAMRSRPARRPRAAMSASASAAPAATPVSAPAPVAANGGGVPHGDVDADDPRILALELEQPDSTGAVFRNLERITPLLRSEVAESDRLGRTTPLAGAALRASGVFRWCFPADRGGLDASYADRLEAVSRIARVDVGMGWVTTWLSAHGEVTASLDDSAFAELYPSIDLPTVFSNTPLARAIEIAGDRYRIEDGRWRLGSGGYHADRWMGGASVWNEAGEPVLDEMTGEQKTVGIWLPGDKVRQLDDWDSSGVRSSGSASYCLSEPVEVPRSWSFAHDVYGARPYFFPFMGVLLGAAQHLIDLTMESLRKKHAAGAPVGAHDKARLAECLAHLDMLVLGLRGYAGYIDGVRAERDTGLTRHEAPWVESAGIPVRDTVLRIRDITSDIYGTGHVAAGSEFNRVLRDIQVATAHLWFRTSDTPSYRSGRVDLMLDDADVKSVWDVRSPREFALVS